MCLLMAAIYYMLRLAAALPGWQLCCASLSAGLPMAGVVLHRPVEEAAVLLSCMLA